MRKCCKVLLVTGHDDFTLSFPIPAPVSNPLISLLTAHQRTITTPTRKSFRTKACPNVNSSGDGDFALWFRLLLLMLACIGRVHGIPIPDCTYSDQTDRSCGIRHAVDQYIHVDSTGGSYGPIEQWDISLVTDLSYAFYGKYHFNANISAWDVGNVTNMANSTCHSLSLQSGLFYLFFYFE